jgi:hypothetical protein
VLSLVIYDEERILESAWRFGLAISNIHAYFLKEMCGEGNRFTFVVPFDHSEIFWG